MVEDEPFIRTATVDYLEDLGYTVFEAKDAASALKVLEKERIELLLTDVGLPGQTGIRWRSNPVTGFLTLKWFSPQDTTGCSTTLTTSASPMW